MLPEALITNPPGHSILSCLLDLRDQHFTITAMEYVRAGRLLARQAKQYFADVLPLARDTFHASLTAALLFLKLLYVLLKPIFSFALRAYRLVYPSIQFLAQNIWTLFCLQPPHILAAEAGLCIVTLGLIFLERRLGLFRRLHQYTIGWYRSVVRRYKAFLSSVRSKSRTAALILPHILFLSIAFSIHYMIGHLIRPFTQGFGMILVTSLKPALKSVFLVYSVDYHNYPQDNPNQTNVMSNQTQVVSIRSNNENSASNSTIRRRKSNKRKSLDAMRVRGAAVNADIQNEPQSEEDLATPRQSRVRINDTPQVNHSALVQSTSHSARASRQPSLTTFASDDNDLRDDQVEVYMLRFWVVFGLVWTIRSIAWYFCPLILHTWVAALDTALFYFFVWAQLGITRGANAMYAIVSKVARRRWRLDAVKRTGERRKEQVNMLLKLAVYAKFISEERAAELGNTITESGLALLGIVFLITPRLATFFGTLLIGLLVPCYLSTSALETGGAEGLTRHNWLSYWAVFSVMDAGYAVCADMFGWVPLWYHLKMVLILWLQLPYYRGSVVILEYIMGYVGSAMSSLRRQAVTPRKRKRA